MERKDICKTCKAGRNGCSANDPYDVCGNPIREAWGMCRHYMCSDLQQAARETYQAGVVGMSGFGVYTKPVEKSPFYVDKDGNLYSTGTDGRLYSNGMKVS